MENACCRDISNDADVMSLLAWGVKQGWSVSMNRDGDIVFDRGGEEEEEVTPAVAVSTLPSLLERFVGGFEHESMRRSEGERPPGEKKRKRTLFRAKERIPLDCGKRLKLSIRVTEDS